MKFTQQQKGIFNKIIKNSLNIDTLSLEHTQYDHPRIPSNEMMTEISIKMRIFKKLLKEFSDLNKSQILRFELTADTEKLELMHREDFNIDNTSLPSLINRNDGTSFKSVEYVDKDTLEYNPEMASSTSITAKQGELLVLI